MDDALAAIILYFVLEFNLRPSSIKNQIDSIKDKFAQIMMPMKISKQTKN